ncbi:RILP-like protein homolog isoform X2 [Nilaparvata lugens]|uniref:RILP-like protein homolog isoform X2 n=1 Tax=Nilaparvata lugens TaxID=108931 RepID=UPI000B985883|nr:RILP-like protein homolog isoform X2 [Nilaparvata lugens]
MPLVSLVALKMEDFEADLSVVDVYDIASEIGKEFEKIIDSHGVEAITSLMPKVINVLEHLEVLATKNERENTVVQELKGKIVKLESEKIEKAEDRQRFERELEQIEDHWKEETQDLLSMVTQLQEENKKLNNSLAAKEDTSSDGISQPLSPEVDICVMQKLRTLVDKLREQLRAKDKELASKSAEIENLRGQNDRLTSLCMELRRKQRVSQMQIRGLIDDRADVIAQVQDHQRELACLRAHLGITQKENEDLTQQPEDPNRPRFTTAELKEILHERNELKARVSDLEDELEIYCPKPAESLQPEDETVQGPLPYEPDDAPWKKKEQSGIRKLFSFKLWN